jgi:hypothetical protein
MAWEWLGSVATAFVGIAGIAGTVWGASVGRRAQLDVVHAQIEADGRRRLYLDKRELYAKILHHLEEYAVGNYNVGRAGQTIQSLKDRLAGMEESHPARPDLQQQISAANERGVEAVEAAHAQTMQFHRLRSELAVVAGPSVSDQVAELGPVINKIEESLQYTEYRERVTVLAMTLHRDLAQVD